jgi:hypothetical protein
VAIRQVFQLTKGGPDPGFVIEVAVILKGQLLGAASESGGPVMRLGVVEGDFTVKAVRAVQGKILR